MMAKITISGVVAATVAVSLALVPASADEPDEGLVAVPVAVLASAETPGHAVWDMTYGAEPPVGFPMDESRPAETETVDLSMG